MSSGMIPVSLPEALVRRLRRAADLTHRTVEDIAASSLAAVLPPAPDLPEEIADELAAMHLLSDAALWTAVEPSLPRNAEARLHHLNAAAGESHLTAAERAEQAALLAAFHRSVLRRAQALAILAQRGHALPLGASASDGP